MCKKLREKVQTDKCLAFGRVLVKEYKVRFDVWSSFDLLLDTHISYAKDGNMSPSPLEHVLWLFIYIKFTKLWFGWVVSRSI